MHRIERLPEHVINKIAAGEVVEQPASIVKECIENCLDAGALRIEVAIEGGGERLIRIEDDGCGMNREDALLSMERHATSKIRTEHDLTSLTTMGFRGEALAAIAAVSHFEIRTSDGSAGTRIAAAGGEIESIGPCARNRGTTIEVRSLFFNVPARKKFLKSSSSNTAQIVRVVETIALAFPEISFSLVSEGKTMISLSAEEQRKRIEHVLGVMPHEVKAQGLWGVIGSPEEAKTHRRGQYLFINRRPIFSPLISRAVKAGYGTRIAEMAHPSFALFLDILPDAVDVNVHPQKKEVRFADEGKVFRLFERAASSAFESKEVFSQPLSFSQPSFSLVAAPAPDYSFAKRAEVPASFDFPLAERPLSVVDGYFFLEREGEGLLLVDLKAAHARVLYESLKEKKGAMQALLWPLEAVIEDEGVVEELQMMGIECRLIGKRRLAVDALPSLLDAADFPHFLNAWREGRKLDGAAVRYVKETKRKFRLEEAFALWQELSRCREAHFDPAGKRIWNRLDANQLRRILEN